MYKRSDGVESPGGHVDDCVLRGHFAWPCVLLDRPPADYHLERSGMQLHGAVG